LEGTILREDLKYKLFNENDYSTNYLLLTPSLAFANGSFRGDILFEKKNCIIKSWIFKNTADYSFINKSYRNITNE
jgi:hypothetical protein